MSTNRRFIIGSLFGLTLSALAVFLSAGDRGTYAPMIANSAFAMFLPGQIFTMTWFPVLLWGIYYAAIPDIRSRTVRIAAALGVMSLHLGFAFWAYQDAALSLAFREYRGVVVLHGLLFAGALGWLMQLAAKPRHSNPLLSSPASAQQIVGRERR